MGCDAEQYLPLVRRLEDETEIALLEVAKPTVNEARRMRGRCSPEVPALGIEAARISRWRRSALPEMPMTIIGRHRMSASQR